MEVKLYQSKDNNSNPQEQMKRIKNGKQKG